VPVPPKEGIGDRWRGLPGYAHGAAGAVVAAVILAALTQNILLAVIFGAVWVLYAFALPSFDGGRKVLTAGVVLFSVGLLFCTAHIYYPGYDCGTVLEHPIRNPTSVWMVQASLKGYRGTDVDSLLGSCPSEMTGFRNDTIGFFVAALIFFLFAARGNQVARRPSAANTK
jgi:hypothetical protein